MAKILLIDDEDGIRRWTAGLLHIHGFEVETACNGHEGMKKAGAEPFDLVITDIIMPEKEGLETIMELRRVHPSIPIIAISGGGSIGSSELLGLAESFGAVATLEKPFRGQELLDAISNILD